MSSPTPSVVHLELESADVNGHIPEKIAKEYYPEWIDLGRPRRYDHKGKQKGEVDLILLYWLFPWWLTPSDLGCSELDCDNNGIPDYLEK